MWNNYISHMSMENKLYHLEDYFCWLNIVPLEKSLSFNQIWDADTVARLQFFLALADSAPAQTRLHLTVSRRLATRRARVCTAVGKSGIDGHVWTAYVDYRLSFADQGKQTSISACSKQTEVCHFSFPFAANKANKRKLPFSKYTYIYIHIHLHIHIYT